MKRIVFLFGSIAGLIIGGMIIASMSFVKEGDMATGAIVGYSTMLITFAVVFFLGAKNYRDKHLNGHITFGKAFLISIYIALLASFIYAAGWEISLAAKGMTGSEFMAQMTNGQFEKMAQDGVSPEVIAQKRQEQMVDNEWYNNIALRFLWTMFGESFLVGLVVALFVAIVLSKKKPVPQNTRYTAS